MNETKLFTEMTDAELVAALPQLCDTSTEALAKFRESIAPTLDEDESFSFDGDENCNDGDGGCSWNGIDRRCNCGNRRISWVFQCGSWSAEAY